MSNPAVIVLANKHTHDGVFKRFVIEDNIGESIHIHIDNMRMDFTVDEFLAFSSTIRDSLESLNVIPGFSLSSFDEHFLMELSDILPDLKSAFVDEVRIKDLKCIVRKRIIKDLFFVRSLPVDETPVYKYVKDGSDGYLSYDQFNYFGVTNRDRLESISYSIETNGYPYNDNYIVLINDQNYIRDGQHRAAVLAAKYGVDYKLKVLRLVFSNQRGSMRKFMPNFRHAIVWFLKKIKAKLIIW